VVGLSRRWCGRVVSSRRGVGAGGCIGAGGCVGLSRSGCERVVPSVAVRLQASRHPSDAFASDVAERVENLRVREQSPDTFL